jgi:hypothetical protein
MVIAQFGMIMRLLRYRWFYKQELLVVLSITVFIIPCSHVHFLNVSLVLCSLHIFISLSSSLAFHVVHHVGSRNTIWSTVLLAHCYLLSFLVGSRVGSSKVKGEPLKNDVGENTRSFQDANTFFYTYRSKMR